jgi:integrase
MVGSLTRARKELAKARADMARGQYEPRRKVPTFCDFAVEYLEHAGENQKATVDLDAAFIKRFKEKHFKKNPRIDQITARDIQKYKRDRQQDQVKNTSRQVSARTVNMELKLLRRMFNLAVKHWKYLRVNPANDVELLPEPQKPMRVLEEHEEARLMETLPKHLQGIFLFGLHTGMRSRSEILALNWDAVDMRRRVVTVKKSKTRTVRIIPLNDVAYNVLRQIRKQHQVGTVFLFNGKPIKRFNHSWTVAVKRAGIPHITFHAATRHTFGTRLARKGVPLNEIKDLMGHTSILTTQRYLHSNEERGKLAVAKLVD